MSGRFEIAPKPQEPEEAPAEPQIPEEFKGKSPAEIAAAVEAERKARSDAEAAAKRQADDLERARQAYTSLAMASLRDKPSETPKPKEAVPDKEEDPDAYIAYQIKHGIQQSLKEQVEPLISQYRLDRTVSLQTAIDHQLMAMRSDPAHFPNFKEVENDVMKYAAQFPQDQLARPGALAEVYRRVMGNRYVEDLSKNAMRDGGPETGGRMGGPTEHVPDAGPQKLSDREAFHAARSGVPHKRFRNLQGGGRVTLTEWREMTAAEKKGA